MPLKNIKRNKSKSFTFEDTENTNSDDSKDAQFLSEFVDFRDCSDNDIQEKDFTENDFYAANPVDSSELVSSSSSETIDKNKEDELPLLSSYDTSYKDFGNEGAKPKNIKRREIVQKEPKTEQKSEYLRHRMCKKRNKYLKKIDEYEKSDEDTKTETLDDKIIKKEQKSLTSAREIDKLTDTTGDIDVSDNLDEAMISANPVEKEFVEYSKKMQAFYVTERHPKYTLAASKTKQQYLEKKVKGYPLLEILSINSIFSGIVLDIVLKNLWEHFYEIVQTKNKLINQNIGKNAILVIYRNLGLKIVFVDCEIVETENNDYESMLRQF
ncbi:hypothetical protein MHBO_003501, partial [Bonamia ostreae]